MFTNRGILGGHVLYILYFTCMCQSNVLIPLYSTIEDTQSLKKRTDLAVWSAVWSTSVSVFFTVEDSVLDSPGLRCDETAASHQEHHGLLFNAKGCGLAALAAVMWHFQHRIPQHSDIHSTGYPCHAAHPKVYISILNIIQGDVDPTQVHKSLQRRLGVSGIAGGEPGGPTKLETFLDIVNQLSL